MVPLQWLLSFGLNFSPSPLPPIIRSSYKEQAQLAADEIAEKEYALAELQSQKNTWETRCFKLREYMRKLTAKCEEWESSYEQQSKILEALHAQQETARAKAAQLGRKYQQLTNDVLHQNQSRIKGRKLHGADISRDQSLFVEDLADVQSIHEELENQLEHIANELQNVSWSDPPGELAALMG